MGGQQEKSTVGGCSLFWLLIFSALAAAAAVILVVMLASWGNTGFIGSGSIAVGTCPNAYLTTKYANLPTFNTAVFVCSCVGALTSCILLLVFVGWVCKICCNSLKPSVSSKGGLFFLLAVTILASIAPLGYYLSFIVELSQCSNNTLDTTNTFATLFMAAALPLLAFIVLALVLCQDYAPTESEEKYRHVRSSQTEPNEAQRERNLMRDSLKQERRSPMILKEEITKENIHASREIAYQSPPKKRMQDPKIYLEPKRTVQSRGQFRPPPAEERGPNRNPPYRQQILTQNLHPALRNADLRSYIESSIPSKHQPQEERSFQKQARKYYDDDRRGILARQGPYEERDRRDRAQRPPYEDRRNRHDDERGREERYSPQRGRERDDFRTPQRRGYSPSPSREERGGIMRNYANYRN